MRILEAIRYPERLRGGWCGCLVGCIGGVGLSETPEPHEYKGTRGVVLLLFETLKDDFEGSETAKCKFGIGVDIAKLGGSF